MNQHKKSRFFIKLLLLIILLVLIISIVYSYGGGKSVVRPGVKNALESSAQIWTEIPKDSTTTMKIKKGKISFTNLTFKTKNKVADVSIEVGSLKEKPSELDEPSGILYQYIEIVTDKIKEDDIEFVSINFKVSKEWTNENDIDDSSINLEKQIDNSWEKLKTNKRNFDANYVYFNSVSPSFSVFAITGEKIKKAEVVEEIQKETIELEETEPEQIEEEIKEPATEPYIYVQTPTVKKSKIPTNAILIILILIILAIFLFLLKKRKL